jgi:hypothetical protein
MCGHSRQCIGQRPISGLRSAAQRLDAVSRGDYFSFAPVQRVLAPDSLAVLAVLDLDPGCRLRRVPGVRLLRDVKTASQAPKTSRQEPLGSIGEGRLISDIPPNAGYLYVSVRLSCLIESDEVFYRA